MVIMIKRRLSVNAIAFLVTSVAVFVSVNITDGFAIKISSDTMSEDTIEDLPNYTDYVDHNSYLSESVTFNSKAMAGYYHLTKNLMNSILDQNILKEDMIDWRLDGNGNYYPQLSDSVTINQLLKDYWVLVFILALLVFITLIVPIGGIIFYCCRCCGKCYAKAEPSDKKRDAYNKIFQGCLIIALCTLLLMGVVCAFATNQQLKEGTNEFPENVRKSYTDSMTYLDSTVEQATHLLRTNFNEFSDVFKNFTRDSGTNILQKMTIWNNASAIYDLFNFVDVIPVIIDHLKLLDQNITELKSSADGVNTELSKIKTNLKETLALCLLPQCVEETKNIDSLQISIDTSLIPDVKPILNDLNGFNGTGLDEAAQAGKDNLNKIEQNVNNTLTDILLKVSNNVDDAGKTIDENLSNMTGIVMDIKSQINDVNKTLEDGYYYITTYSPYFYYAGLVISCILLLIPACIGLGLIWGLCGKRPEKHHSESCTKKTGSFFLESAAFIIFTSTIIMGVLTVVMLIIGLAVDRGVCYTLRNPTQSTVMKILDDFATKNKKIEWNISLSNILVKCNNNESIYQVFDLSSRFDIEHLVEQLDVNATLDNIMSTVDSQVSNILASNLPILNKDNEKKLMDLTRIKSDVDIDAFQRQLNQNVTNTNVQDLIQSLQEIQVQVPEPLSGRLKANIQQLEDFEKQYLQPLITQVHQVLDLAITVNSELELNSTSFQAGITELISSIKDAEGNLAKNPKLITEAASSFGEAVKGQVGSYLQRVVHVTTDELGQCGHLNVAMNSTLIATCDKIVLPWNGFWVSLFISLLVFIPTVIVLITLASIYKKYKMSMQYTGGQRFMLDKRQKKAKMRDGRFSDGGPVKHESRYDDMAPKSIPYVHYDPQTQSTRF